MDKAEEMKPVSPGIVAWDKKKPQSRRIDAKPTGHFKVYHFYHGIIQDVGYGTKLKFENGFEQVLPLVVATSKYSCIINSYL